MSELERWEARFSEPGYLFGTEPNAFLKSKAHLLTAGQKVLSIADGEGRNGVFLAGLGCEVLATDISPNALAKSKALAKERGVTLRHELADLETWPWPAEVYDVIVGIFFQFLPPALRTRVFEGIKRALKPGGLLLIEGYGLGQLQYKTGGPSEPEQLYTRPMLQDAFGDFSSIEIEEYDNALSEGDRHKGMSALIDLVGRKSAFATRPSHRQALRKGAVMIKMLRLGHASFETADIDKAIEHHTQVIGLSLVGRERDRAFLATRTGQLAIEFTRGPRSQCTKLSFEVPANADFADIRRELQSHGVASEERSDSVPGLTKVLSFKDPKGTSIELFRDWNYVGNQQPVAGVGALKLGHIAFIVPEPKQMAEFYGKVLGFRISDWIADFFVFLRCNADHHTVNFIRGDKVNMHHIAYEVKDFAHLQSACDILGQKKIPIAWGPVRLGPGHNIATFHRDADDWITEFYAELDQMKDEELGYFDPRPWHQDRPQRPKVWDNPQVASIWGTPPTPDFFRR